LGSRAEQIVSSNLRVILGPLAQGDTINDSENFRIVLSGLEYFIPAVLGDKYHFWKGESLDGFYLTKASKTTENEAELIGMCILISDQTLTPFHIRLRVAAYKDEIEWLNCRLGERREGVLLKIPYGSSKWGKYMYNLEVNSIDWVYEVTINA